jgi:hypothetical protein
MELKSADKVSLSEKIKAWEEQLSEPCAVRAKPVPPLEMKTQEGNQLELLLQEMEYADRKLEPPKRTPRPPNSPPFKTFRKLKVIAGISQIHSRNNDGISSNLSASEALINQTRYP